jgi:hypothetical protein
MARNITELEKLKAKLIIDEYANKAARWAARWNALPLFGGQIGEQFMHNQWGSMRWKLQDLFALQPEERIGLLALTDSYSMGKYMQGKQIGFMAAAIIPDFGIVTRSAVEDLARNMTKTVGWICYCIIEEGNYSPSPEVFDRIIEKAKTMM